MTLYLKTDFQVKSISAGLFTSRGFGTHPVRVMDSYELIFVNSGQLNLYEEGQEFSLNSGQTLILYPNRKHGGASEYDPQLSFYWIHFDVLRNADSQYGLPTPQVCQISDPIRMIELYRRYLHDQETGRLDPALGSLLVLQMLWEVFDSSKTKRAIVTDRVPALVDQARKYISKNIHLPISTLDVAGELECNPQYLSRVFHRACGCTITEFLHQKRLSEARRKLLDKTLTIEQVAKACGFGSACYLRRLFGRHAGLSPGAYRRLYARLHVNS